MDTLELVKKPDKIDRNKIFIGQILRSRQGCSGHWKNQSDRRRKGWRCKPHFPHRYATLRLMTSLQNIDFIDDVQLNIVGVTSIGTIYKYFFS